ncbi:hypothetical protein SAMN05444392_12325 [Seinonella peptonophila]|uniref:Uncharacterized protein n=1 Tax=Seinonella peptonophila TaxID=112248 RepID=A0A1M5BGJ3_9BACL|nr:hypothetical protein [Seinonella peptonophila]SHF41536.1 hypothetical protein SAMN05444392_12325 [Seinonella peptonophila]
MATINIADLNKAAVLAALYNNAKPQGKSWLWYRMTIKQAQALLVTHVDFKFDGVNNRVLKVDLSGEEFDSSLYDLHNGTGKAERTVNHLRETGFVECSNIDIADLDKAAVLAALFNGAKPQGNGGNYLRWMSTKKARSFQVRTYKFGCESDRILKVDLSGEEFDSSLYDRHNGEGMADRVVNRLRAGYIDISGLDKAAVLAALYCNAKSLRMPRKVYVPYSGRIFITIEQAQSYLDGGLTFDTIEDHVLRIDLSGEEFNPSRYDRFNGAGKAQRVIEHLRMTGSISLLT